MNPWTEEEERRLKGLTVSPHRNSPEKLSDLVQHFRKNGSVFGVTEGDDKPHVSRDLARKIKRLTVKGKLGWVLKRGASPIQTPRQPNLSGEFIQDVMKLAEVIEKRITVPKPGTPLLNYDEAPSRATERQLEQAVARGDTSPYVRLLTTSLRTPWWRSDGETQVVLNLSDRQSALMARFDAVPTSLDFVNALKGWLKTAGRYLDLVKECADQDQIQAAYLDAERAGADVHAQLWNAVEALR